MSCLFISLSPLPKVASTLKVIPPNPWDLEAPFKVLEQIPWHTIPPDMGFIIRFDGNNFGALKRRLLLARRSAPGQPASVVDKNYLKAMVNTTGTVVGSLNQATFAYTFSDEISVYFPPQRSIKSGGHFLKGKVG